ncbi:MAG: hypothetical protein JNM76_18465 [Betaproteobacteria bacterium]|nr:hypothetical protein [Betaproteobacteria bacterium]
MNPITTLMKGSTWLFPAVETFHILGFALLAGSIAILDIRVLGASRTLPVTTLAKHILPWTLIGALVAVTSGALLFAAQIDEMFANRLFIIKMGLLALAACNAAYFHSVPWTRVSGWDTNTPAPTDARVSAAISLLLWISIIFCGRFIAYV